MMPSTKWFTLVLMTAVVTVELSTANDVRRGMGDTGDDDGGPAAEDCLDACGYFESDGTWVKSGIKLVSLRVKYLGYNYNNLNGLSHKLPMMPNGDEPKQPFEKLDISEPGPSGGNVNIHFEGTKTSPSSSISLTNIQPGTEFTLNQDDKWPADLIFNIVEGSKTHIVMFHSSCSHPIMVGDIYGSIEITGVTNTANCNSDDFTTVTTTTKLTTTSIIQAPVRPYCGPLCRPCFTTVFKNTLWTQAWMVFETIKQVNLNQCGLACYNHGFCSGVFFNPVYNICKMVFKGVQTKTNPSFAWAFYDFLDDQCRTTTTGTTETTVTTITGTSTTTETTETVTTSTATGTETSVTVPTVTTVTTGVTLPPLPPTTTTKVAGTVPPPVGTTTTTAVAKPPAETTTVAGAAGQAGAAKNYEQNPNKSGGSDDEDWPYVFLLLLLLGGLAFWKKRPDGGKGSAELEVLDEPAFAAVGGAGGEEDALAAGLVTPALFVVGGGAGGGGGGADGDEGAWDVPPGGAPVKSGHGGAGGSAVGAVPLGMAGMGRNPNGTGDDGEYPVDANGNPIYGAGVGSNGQPLGNDKGQYPVDAYGNPVYGAQLGPNSGYGPNGSGPVDANGNPIPVSGAVVNGVSPAPGRGKSVHHAGVATNDGLAKWLGGPAIPVMKPTNTSGSGKNGDDICSGFKPDQKDPFQCGSCGNPQSAHTGPGSTIPAPQGCSNFKPSPNLPETCEHCAHPKSHHGTPVVVRPSTLGCDKFKGKPSDPMICEICDVPEAVHFNDCDTFTPSEESPSDCFNCKRSKTSHLLGSTPEDSKVCACEKLKQTPRHPETCATCQKPGWVGSTEHCPQFVPKVASPLKCANCDKPKFGHGGEMPTCAKFAPSTEESGHPDLCDNCLQPQSKHPITAVDGSIPDDAVSRVQKFPISTQVMEASRQQNPGYQTWVNNSNNGPNGNETTGTSSTLGTNNPNTVNPTEGDIVNPDTATRANNDALNTLTQKRHPNGTRTDKGHLAGRPRSASYNTAIAGDVPGNNPEAPGRKASSRRPGPFSNVLAALSEQDPNNSGLTPVAEEATPTARAIGVNNEAYDPNNNNSGSNDGAPSQKLTKDQTKALKALKKANKNADAANRKAQTAVDKAIKAGVPASLLNNMIGVNIDPNNLNSDPAENPLDRSGSSVTFLTEDPAVRALTKPQKKALAAAQRAKNAAEEKADQAEEALNNARDLAVPENQLDVPELASSPVVASPAWSAERAINNAAQPGGLHLDGTEDGPDMINVSTSSAGQQQDGSNGNPSDAAAVHAAHRETNVPRTKGNKKNNNKKNTKDGKDSDTDDSISSPALTVGGLGQGPDNSRASPSSESTSEELSTSPTLKIVDGVNVRVESVRRANPLFVSSMILDDNESSDSPSGLTSIAETDDQDEDTLNGNPIDESDGVVRALAMQLEGTPSDGPTATSSPRMKLSGIEDNNETPDDIKSRAKTARKGIFSLSDNDGNNADDSSDSPDEAGLGIQGSPQSKSSVPSPSKGRLAFNNPAGTSSDGSPSSSSSLGTDESKMRLNTVQGTGKDGASLNRAQRAVNVQSPANDNSKQAASTSTLPEKEVHSAIQVVNEAASEL